MEKDCPKDCHKKAPFIFRKVVIPASIDDDSKNPPKNGAYHNVIVVYEATGNAYIYSSDGIPTRVSADIGDIDAKIAKAVGDEAEIRSAADQEIWTEIETIEASSDVVDVVGTYAELEAYDTSKLKDNDLIKVLADETRDDAITYYRWSTTTDTFTYVGSEGPYYTSSEVDTLLGGKQNTLTAGSNIQINGDTISATDTTYSVMGGASAGSAGTSGLVPAPAAGDQDKVLRGDGTWGNGAANTIFYRNSQETGATRHIYKSSDMTGLATMQDLLNANEKGQVILRLSTASHPENYSDAYLQNAYVGTNDYQMLFLDEKAYTSFDTTLTSDNTFYYSRRELQDKLTAGSNITITSNTISATDTTYSDFTGTDGLVAGTHGLVPAPATTDTNKYLKSDGTWATVQSGGGASITDYFISNTLDGIGLSTPFTIYSDESLTTAVSKSDFFNAVMSSTVRLTYNNTGNESVEYYIDYSGESAGDWDDNNESMYNARQGDTLYDIWWDSTLPEVSGKTVFQPKLTAGSNISIGTVLGVDNTISVTGMPVLYGSQGQNTDGAVTQKVFTDTVGDVESILQILNSGSGV